jgi:hypothetical protein
MYQLAVLVPLQELQFLHLMSASLITVAKISSVINGSSSFY